jgi:ATP-dependent Lhr-like helicase
MPTSDQESAFSLLHPSVQAAVFRLGWKRLHPIQARAFRVFFGSTADIVVAAPTASGKTEALGLPIISNIVENPKASVQDLMISPLRALINDQFRRLSELGHHVGVPVHRWHSDVGGSAKNRVLDEPRGIMIITPESLEARIMKHPEQVQKLFGELDYIVIDELHSFIGEERGAHLQSLLSRLQDIIGRRPRRAALSATMGDLNSAKRFLNQDAPESVVVIEQRGHDREVRVFVRAFIQPAIVKDNHNNIVIVQMSPEHVVEAANSLDFTNGFESPFREIASPIVANPIWPLEVIASEVLKLTKEGSSLCFCNRRLIVEELAKRCRGQAEKHGRSYHPVFAHHSSLAKNVREETETTLKSGKPVVAIATSSLELGIDIGRIERIFQVQSPARVSSLRQRVGRSGRQAGQPSTLRFYSIDGTPTRRSILPDWLFPDHLTGIAMIELLIENMLEPHGPDRFHLSTLVHQTLAVLYEKRVAGSLTTYGELHETLCVKGAFRKVDQAMFQDVMRSLRKLKLIDQTDDGSLLLGPEGERITSWPDFYVAFKTRSVYAVRNEGKDLGEIESAMLPREGELITLNGRNWRVQSINRVTRVVHVVAASVGAPAFRGYPMDRHTMIFQKVREVLQGADDPPYLDPAAKLLLSAARTIARKAGLDRRTVLQSPEGIRWFPWIGTRGMRAIGLFSVYESKVAYLDNLSVFYPGLGIQEFRGLLRRILDERVDPVRLASLMREKLFERFDEYLPESLLDRVNAVEGLDLDDAQLAARAALDELGEA